MSIGEVSEAAAPLGLSGELERPGYQSDVSTEVHAADLPDVVHSLITPETMG